MRPIPNLAPKGQLLIGASSFTRTQAGNTEGIVAGSPDTFDFEFSPRLRAQPHKVLKCGLLLLRTARTTVWMY